MQLPERRKQIVRRQMQKRKREIHSLRRRFFSTIRWENGRKRRMKAAGLLAAAACYLFFAWCGNHRGFVVQDEYAAELCLPSSGEEQETFRVVFRLKTGELFFFHESRRIDNADP